MVNQLALNGREPLLGGDKAPPLSTGQEPMLGGEHFLKLVRQALLEQLNDSEISHLKRANIGNWLNDNGDTRPGVGLRDDGLPDIVWCAVPGGDVLLRHDTEPRTVDRFYIAKLPITWAQYRLFLDDPDGHAHHRWWAGLLWRPEYDRVVEPVDNQPAQEISWYDAVAYCRWLSDKLGYEVRLPSEWEWQQAASGGEDGREFPWGPRWDGRHSNTRESGLRRVTAVGMYPLGASPVGALDMSGTILEWCQNEFANPGNLNPGGIGKRVYRGGSWYQIGRYAKTDFRTGNDPFLRYHSVGLRLATSVPVFDLPETPPAQ